jgi:hypothetical protein
MNSEEIELLRLIKYYEIDPWDSSYYPLPKFTKEIEDFEKSDLLLNNYYDNFIITILGKKEARKFSKNKIALIGLAPNNPPHLGTLLQLMAANYYEYKYKFIISFNDIEARLIRNIPEKTGNIIISKEYHNALKYLNIKPDEIVIRSRVPEIHTLIKQIKNLSDKININDFYNRTLNDHEKNSVMVMCAEFIRNALIYKNIITFYGVEEGSHLLYIRQVMKYLNLEPPICYISRQIPSFDINKKMSKSKNNNIYYNSKPTNQILRGINSLEEAFVNGLIAECPYEYIDNILLGYFPLNKKHNCSVRNHKSTIKKMNN